MAFLGDALITVSTEAGCLPHYFCITITMHAVFWGRWCMVYNWVGLGKKKKDSVSAGLYCVRANGDLQGAVTQPSVGVHLLEYQITPTAQPVV